MPLSWTFSTHDLGVKEIDCGTYKFRLVCSARVWIDGEMTERNREQKTDSCRRRSPPPLGSVLGGLHGEQREGPLPLMDGWKVSCQD